MYRFVETTARSYELLQDELSKKLFWDRLKYEMAPTLDNIFQIVRTAVGDGRKHDTYWEDIFDAASSSSKKIILYGPGELGKGMGQQILESGKDFYGYCGRNFKKHTGGILGKPVVSPQFLQDHADECYVIISTIDFYGSVFEDLKQLGFPESHILLFTERVEDVEDLHQRQYFDFPQLYKKGTAFIDAGCFDCSDSLKFNVWCGGVYSKIYAFEPDTANFTNCKRIAEDRELKNIELFHAAVGKIAATAQFVSQCGTASHLAKNSAEQAESMETVQIVALDEVIDRATRVGFIKMDIEGAEYDALIGARSILLRDKPLLAICIYHKRGDMLAIMDLLHTLVPEYIFWIRHYSMTTNETVLYAAIPEETCGEDGEI